MASEDGARTPLEKAPDDQETMEEGVENQAVSEKKEEGFSSETAQSRHFFLILTNEFLPFLFQLCF